MSGASMTWEGTVAAAARKGNARIVTPEPNQLFLDIDSDEDFSVFLDNLDILQEELEYLPWSVTPSKSGLPHRHVTVTLPAAVTPIERCLLQAVLGSDRKHELLTWRAIRNGTSPHPTVFFEQAF